MAHNPDRGEFRLTVHLGSRISARLFATSRTKSGAASTHTSRRVERDPTHSLVIPTRYKTFTPLRGEVDIADAREIDVI